MTERPIELQKVVDEFEREWRTKGRPPIDAYLDEVTADFHVDLLERLIPIDIAQRANASEAVLASDYAQFGEAAARVAHACIQRHLGQELLNDSVGDPGRQTVVERNPSETGREVTACAATPEVVGNYRLLQKLGEGGMGTVWMAEQQRPVRRRVALKLIKTGADNKQILARFDAEQQALAMMNHENIAKVFDAGVSDLGQPYFVMELVHGVPFHRYCDKNKLSIVERLNLFVPACRAIQHAHQKGIIHRDIKPSNVLVAIYDGKATAKVIDFGLAKALQHQSKLTDRSLFTEFGHVVGTLQYMSPEQAELVQFDIDTRTDIYSLGIMLYELLTGHTPIARDVLNQHSLLKVLELIRESETLTPSAHLNGLSVESQRAISDKRQIEPMKLQGMLRGDLDWIVMKSIEKDRRRRYETANDFAEDVVRFLNGDTVSARPPTMSYRVQKYVRKNKGLVASLCSIASLFIIGLIGSIWFSLAMIDARRLADEKTLEAERNSESAKRFAEVAIAEKTKAEGALIRSLISEAGLLAKLKDPPGWSWAAGEKLDQAMALNPSDAELIQLRSLKIACETGHDARRLMHLPGEYWSRICFSRNGEYLAVGERNENGPAEIRVYSTKNWSEVKSLRIDDNLIKIATRLWEGRKHQEGVTTLSFCPNDRWLIAGSRQGQLCAWDVKADFKKVDQWTAFEKSSVQTLTISADSLKLVALSSGTSNPNCKAWEFRDAKWRTMETAIPKRIDALLGGHLGRLGVQSGEQVLWFDNLNFQSASPFYPTSNKSQFHSQSGMHAAYIEKKQVLSYNPHGPVVRTPLLIPPLWNTRR
jgi:serine/threonine protein kinase